ncbi:hypothetical protein D3C80_1034200 [compost metagenome]
MLRPADTVSMPGLTSRLVTSAPVTVREALLLTDTPLTTAVALISVVPTSTPTACPDEVMVAMRGSLSQLALADIGKLVPSDISAVASYCWLKPMGTEPLAGVTCKAVTVASVTVSCALPLKIWPLTLVLALRVAVPALAPVAKPVTLMVAMPGSLLLQLASSTGWLLPSDSMAVALYCCGKPTGALSRGGVSCRLVTVALLTFNCAEPARS